MDGVGEVVIPPLGLGVIFENLTHGLHLDIESALQLLMALLGGCESVHQFLDSLLVGLFLSAVVVIEG